MFKKNSKTDYTSEIDDFFHDLDKARKNLPASRIKEIEKHQKIFAKRDKPIEEAKSDIWEGF